VRPGTVRLVGALQRCGISVATVSASREIHALLATAGIVRRFDAVVDGRDCEGLQLPGRPHPALLLGAARRLRTSPEHTAVVEAALPRGGFRLVVGVDRTHAVASQLDLVRAGADLIVRDPSELLTTPAIPVADRRTG
jgi:alpha,alpha-trehalase